MNARRNVARRGWPRGLYEPRPGYFVFRTPDGHTLPLGRVSLALAKAEAAAANLHLAGGKPSLIERITGGDKTLGDVLDKMPSSTVKTTAATQRSQDKAIRAALGGKACHQLTVADCAELIEGIEAQGKARSAQAIRSRLVAVCRRGMQLGWMDANPAEVTREPVVEVRRGRLTLETYRQIRGVADRVNEWIGGAMDLALVTGADRVTISTMSRKQLSEDWLEYERSKTGIRLRVPLSLELAAVGLKLRELVRSRTGVASNWLVHHVRPHGNAPTGSRVFEDAYSKAFTAARRLAGIPDEGAPTFHEIRSLAKRLYEAQGNVDTRWLLGHKDERTARMYADPRGAEAVVVKVEPLPANEREVNNK